jgi:hypothetical protein
LVVSRSLLLLACCAALGGCQTLALSVAGAGATAALGHRLNGAAYRTFTAPYPAVKKASLAALKKMGITLDSLDKLDYGEIIYARAEGRTIEIELEPISRQATRIRVATQNGSFFYDHATAREIVLQTEKML